MQLEKLTTKSQEALKEAQQIARGYSHQEVDGEHLLLALIGQTDSLIPDLMEKLGVPGSKLKPELESELARRHKVQGISSTDLFLSATLKKVLDAAEAEAGKLKDEYISTEHLLLGLLDQGGSSLKKLFQTNGLKRDLVMRALTPHQLESFFPGGWSEAPILANERLGDAVIVMRKVECIAALDAKEISIDATLVAIVSPHDLHTGIGTADT